MKAVIRKAHLILGLLSGIIVFIVSVTECLYVFQEEIQYFTQEYRRVEPRDTPVLPPSVLRSITLHELPEKHLRAILYGEKHKAAQTIFFSFDPEYYDIVFIDPYKGNVQEVMDVDSSFFHWVLDGLFYLWLPEEIGQPVVSIATLLFGIMIITGLVL